MKFCPKCGGALGLRPVFPDDKERLVCGECGFVFYLDPKVAAGTIPEVDGKLILTRRAINPCRGKWVFPGGYVERGETVGDAAVRETLEETNLEVTLDGLLNVYSYTGALVVVIVYTARVTGGVLKAGPECLEVKAFDPRDIPWDELAFPSTADALKEWLARGRGPCNGNRRPIN